MTSLEQIATTVTESQAAAIRAAAAEHAGLPPGSRGGISAYIRSRVLDYIKPQEIERETNGETMPSRTLEGPTTQLSAWVPAHTKERIDAEAAARGVSVSALIAAALGV